jgi:hypothetical protein
MEGYAKLWSSIIHSTVWAEADHVRILWITMLAIADSEGYVGASIPGLASAAKIPLTACEAGLIRLLSPDTYSRTKLHEGRRIEEADGGWIILNYRKHRDTHDEEERRRQGRERARRFREKHKGNNGKSNAVTRTVTKSNDIAESRGQNAEAIILSLPEGEFEKVVGAFTEWASWFCPDDPPKIDLKKIQAMLAALDDNGRSQVLPAIAYCRMKAKEFNSSAYAVSVVQGVIEEGQHLKKRPRRSGAARRVLVLPDLNKPGVQP